MTTNGRAEDLIRQFKALPKSKNEYSIMDGSMEYGPHEIDNLARQLGLKAAARSNRRAISHAPIDVPASARREFGRARETRRGRARQPTVGRIAGWAELR